MRIGVHVTGAERVLTSSARADAIGTEPWPTTGGVADVPPPPPPQAARMAPVAASASVHKTRGLCMSEPFVRGRAPALGPNRFEAAPLLALECCPKSLATQVVGPWAAAHRFPDAALATARAAKTSAIAAR